MAYTGQASDPKQIAGQFFVDRSGSLYAVFVTNSASGRDALLSVSDVTADEIQPNSTKKVREKLTTTFTLKYANWRYSSLNKRQYKVIFDSGLSATISVKTPGKNHVIPEVYSLLGSAPQASFSLKTETANAYDYSSSLYLSKDYGLKTFMIAESSNDPGGFLVGGLQKNVYEINVGSGIYVASSDLQNEFLNNYRIDAASDRNLPGLNYQENKGGIDNLGKFFGAGGRQEVHFMAVTKDPVNDNPEAENYKSSIVTGFVFSIQLKPYDADANTYYVCLDDTSSNYYTTSNNDCDGTSITAAEQANDSNVFIDGQCCATCDDFNVEVEVTAASYGVANGKIKVNTTGGTANYTIVLAAPSGYTYSGTATVSGSSTGDHTYTGVGGVSTATAYYNVTVTDSTTGTACSQAVKVHVPELLSATNEGCTDNSTPALNYDANADSNSPSWHCLYCGDENSISPGNIVDENGQFAPGTQGWGQHALFNTLTSDVQTTPSNGSSTDGEIYLNFTLNSIPIYLSFGQGSATYNLSDFFTGGTWTVERYTISNVPAMTNGVVTSVNSTTHPVSSLGSSTDVTGLTTPSTTITGLASGWYAFKFKYVVSGSVQPEESCYHVEYAYIPRIGCNDQIADNYDSGTADGGGDCSGVVGGTDVSCCDYTNVCNADYSWVFAPSGNSDCNGQLMVFQNNVSTAFATTDPEEGYAVIIDGTPVPATVMILTGWASWDISYGQTIDLIATDSNGCSYNILTSWIVGVTGSGWGTGGFDEIYNDVVTDGLYLCPQGVPVYGCTDPVATNYDPLATDDDGSCVYPPPPVIGCTDPLASNFNSLANTPCNDNGTDNDCCQYVVEGCTDPTASNYNASANQDDGTCIYPCDAFMLTATATDATIPTAGDGEIVVTIDSGYTLGNYTASATILSSNDPNYAVNNFNGPSSTETPGNSYTHTFSGLNSGIWAVQVLTSQLCVAQITVTVGASNTGYGCTDPAADNYDSTAVTDDGSCEISGCMDPLAGNYNPGANLDDGSCWYNLATPTEGTSVNVCIPKNITAKLDHTRTCLITSGSRFYNKIITGLQDDCDNMNIWKVMIINYLLEKKGLGCLYNCADGTTPDLSTLESCEERWSKEGTSYTWDSSTTYYPGDVVKYTNDQDEETIYVLQTMEQGIPGIAPIVNGISGLGLSPITVLGSKYWKKCQEPPTFADTTNYIDIFTNFVLQYCQNCNIDPYLKLDDPSANLGDDDFTVGGGTITIDGQTFN